MKEFWLLQNSFLILGDKMYRAVELKELTVKPRINDITLNVLREYYEMFLCPFIYTYTVKSKNNQRTISVRFNSYNFCHLLGIESIAKPAVRLSELHNYRGEDGWNNIKDGIVDIRHLKQLNRRQFQNVKAKYVYFYLIPSLLESPLAVNYDKSKVMPPTRIDCEILFYSTYDNAVIHLGLEKVEQEEYYIPRTFFVEKLGKEGDKDIYIDNQEEITVIKESKIIML